MKSFYSELLTDGRRDGRGGLSGRTVAYIGVVLSRSLKDAVAQQVIAKNPCVGVRRPRQKSTGEKMRTWTAPQLGRFLEHVSTDRLSAAWMLAAMTGMRRSEVLGLGWDAVDLDAGRLSVVRGLVVVDGRPLLRDAPKTTGSRRMISLDPATVRALRTWRRQQLEERIAWGAAYQESGLAFTREDGTAIHPDWFSDRFEKHARGAALPRIRLHDLRHSHASLLLQAGIHSKVVMERLGHSSISITLDTYSHLIPAMQEDAAERAAALMLGTFASSP